MSNFISHRPRGLRPFLLAILAFQAFSLVLPAVHGFDAVMAQEQGGGNQGGTPPPGGDLDVDVDINSGPDQTVWYTQWWMWAIGVAVFLIVVIALTRGRSAG